MSLASSLPVLTIPEAAAKHGADVKRLRGAVWRENQTGELHLPIGSSADDVVQDDGILAQWVARQQS